jgi:hypothetical protein
MRAVYTASSFPPFDLFSNQKRKQPWESSTMQLYSELPGEEAVVFLHNFRCAGNAAVYILSEEFGPDAIFRYGKLGDTVADFEDFKSAAATGDRRLYLGHFCYGVHRHIKRPVTYLTNIRDPFERVVSHYAVRNAEAPCSFEHWFDFDFDATNGMVKRLCGFGYKEGQYAPFDFVNDRPLPKGFEVDDSHLEQALETVESADIRIIVQDLLIESLGLLQKQLGCRPLFSLFKQQFNRFPTKPDLAENLKRFEDGNQLDQRLYGSLRARVADRLSAQDTKFAEQVLALKFLERIVSHPGKHTLGFAEFLERLSVAIETLILEQRFALIGELVKVILTKPNLPVTFWGNSIRMLDEIGQQEDADYCRELFRRCFGEHFPF